MPSSLDARTQLGVTDSKEAEADGESPERERPSEHATTATDDREGPSLLVSSAIDEAARTTVPRPPQRALSPLEAAARAAAAHPPPPPLARHHRRNASEPLYRGQSVAVAASKGDLPLVAMLFFAGREAGRDMLSVDAEGNIPLHYAALADDPEVAAFLLRQMQLQAATASPAAASRAAAWAVDARNAAGETALLRAAVAGYVPTIRFLAMDAHADVLATDARGNTVLHNAARNGRLWALLWLLEHVRQHYGEPEVAQMLARGDCDGHTALEWASYSGHLGVVRVLLREGLDYRARDDTGKTLLHWCCSQGRAPLARYLVGLGLDPDQKDGTGKSAREYAAEHIQRSAAMFEALGPPRRRRAGLFGSSVSSGDVESDSDAEDGAGQRRKKCRAAPERRRRFWPPWRRLRRSAKLGPKWASVTHGSENNTPLPTNPVEILAAAPDAGVGTGPVATAVAVQRVRDDATAAEASRESLTSTDLETGPSSPESPGRRTRRARRVDVREQHVLPRRLNYTRPWVVACWSLPLCVFWSLSMVMPWWLWLLLAALFAFCYLQFVVPYGEQKKDAAVEAAQASAPGQGQAQPELEMDPLATVIMAPERFLGLWLGCILSFAIYFSVAGAGLATFDPTSTSRFAARPLRHTPGLAWLEVALLSATVLLWLGLVWLREDAGALLSSEADFAFLRQEVVRCCGPPDPKAMCATCLVRKPLRSKHCAACGMCVARMDHHCVWLNNCVGRRNHALFLTFVAIHLLACIVFVGLATIVWVDGVAGASACYVVGELLSTTYFPTVILGLVAALAVGMLGLILGEQCWNASVNLTTNERINFRRYPWLRAPGPGPAQGRSFNQYDRGIRANCTEFWRGGDSTHGGCAGSRDLDYYTSYGMPQLDRLQQKRLAKLNSAAAAAAAAAAAGNNSREGAAGSGGGGGMRLPGRFRRGLHRRHNS